MNLCIPVIGDAGLTSRVSAHFGSAPFFMITDPATGACRAVRNQNTHNRHGMCAPIAALQGESIEAVALGGIGVNALAKLEAAGIRVYLTEHSTVGETVTAFQAGTLQRLEPGMACIHGHGAQHGRGQGGSQGHGAS